MADYRLFILDPDDRVRRGIEFVAADDETAIGLARDHLDGEPAELWNLARKVKRFRSDGPAPRSVSSGPDAEAP